MKSNSAEPDFVWMSRSKAAIDAWLRCDQFGDDRRVGLDRSRRARTVARGAIVGERPDEAAAIEDGLQRVPDQRIGSPQRPPGDRRGSSATPAAG